MIQERHCSHCWRSKPESTGKFRTTKNRSQQKRWICFDCLKRIEEAKQRAAA